MKIITSNIIKIIFNNFDIKKFMYIYYFLQEISKFYKLLSVFQLNNKECRYIQLYTIYFYNIINTKYSILFIYYYDYYYYFNDKY